MRFNLLQNILVLILADIPLFVFMDAYLNIPTKIFSILTFLILLDLIILTYIFNKKMTYNIKTRLPSSSLIFASVYVVCILITAFTPANNQHVVIDLNSIGFDGWLRVLAGLLIGLFLPGYTIITSFNHKLGRISLLLTSTLLAIFVNSLISFTAVLLSQPSITWLLISNITILCLGSLRIYQKRKEKAIKQLHNVTVELTNEHLLLILLCVFQISILISIFILTGLPFPNGDMWDHTANAVKLENNDLLRFGYLTYPPFFSVHLFSANQLAGIPSMNISNLLGLLNVLIILAFYSLTINLTKKRSVAFLSTFVFTTFGSFTFLIQAFLGQMSVDPQDLAQSFQLISGKTMQINSVYPVANFYAYAPVTLDLILVLVLTLLLTKKEKGKILYAVEALLTTSLFLLHIAELAYVLIFLLAALVLSFTKLKDVLSITVGVWVGFALLSALPFTRSSTSLYLTLSFTIVFLIAVASVRINFHLRLRNYFHRIYHTISTKETLRNIMAFTLIALYGFLLLVWVTSYIQNDGYITNDISAIGAAPTYFMPLIFGVPLLISTIYFAQKLVSKTSCDLNETKLLLFLILAFVLAFILGKAITYSAFLGYPIYRELRIIQVFGSVLFSIGSGYALYKVSKHLKESSIKRKQILALSLGLLVLFGSGSTLISTVLWANKGVGSYSLNSDEIDALDFLKLKIKPSEVVITYSQESKAKVGLTGATTINRYSDFFNSVSSSIPQYFLQQIDYIYLTKSEYTTIQQSSSYVQALLPLLPVLFNNTETMIFSVPQYIKNYQSTESVPVILTSSMEDALPKLAILDSLGLSYSVYNEVTPTILEKYQVILLTSDNNVTESITAKLDDWVRKGGNLIVLGGEGYYSKLLSIQPKTETLFNETWETENSISNWNFDLRSGLSMNNISIIAINNSQVKNSLLINATQGGTLGFSHSLNQSLTFPFAVGTWFKLENQSSIKNSLILMNGQASGVGLWDANYGLDYYYDGKIVYDIAEISQNSWQKIELYFPDPETCNVYLNGTLVFVGPRTSLYDSIDVTYGSAVKSLIDTWFVGSYQAMWANLYYATNQNTSANGVFCGQEFISGTTCFNLKNVKTSMGLNVFSSSWYAMNYQKVAPLTFSMNSGVGNITYLDSTNLPNIVTLLGNSSKTLLESICSNLLNYTNDNQPTMSLPIEIYGSQNLTGKINLSSREVALYGSNVSFAYKLSNGTEINQLIENNCSLLFNSVDDLCMSLNGSIVISPLTDNYVQVLISDETPFTIYSCFQKNESFNYGSLPGSTVEPVESSISSNLPITLIIRTPNVAVKGALCLSGAFFDIPYNSIIGSGTGPITMTGNMSYALLLSDQCSDRVFGDVFELNGSYTYNYASFLQIELPVDFTSVLTVLVLLVILLYSAFVIFLLKT